MLSACRRSVLGAGFRPANGKGELSRQFSFHPQGDPALRPSGLPSVGREPGSRSASSALAEGKGKPSAMLAARNCVAWISRKAA